MKLGVVGAGKIIPFHLEAAEKIGFEFESIVASQNSTNAKKISAEFDFRNCYSEIDDFLITADKLDAVLIAPKATVLFETLKKISAIGIPILVEKPIFTNIEELEKIGEIKNQEKIIVGYNRRYYETILYLKKIISSNKSARIIFRIPELSGMSNFSKLDMKNIIIENSVHMIDLIQFILGTESINSDRLASINFNSDSILISLSDDGMKTCEISFGYAQNYSIESYLEGVRIEVKPLESIRAYSVMKIFQPDDTFPFKRYVPESSSNLSENFNVNSETKPGFEGQYRDLANLVNGKPNEIAATLEDAARVSKFALILSEKFINN
jgi:predicted dehydrogenase